MIVLDTNIVSELMRPPDERSQAVLSWLRGTSLESLCTTAITVAEIGVGINKLPNGRRRDDFESAARRAFKTYFPRRILPFDQAAAESFGPLIAERRRKGRHFHGFDFQILAIAASRGFAVATRNTRDFSDVGVELVNPWDHPAP
ncbi:type II toxin-antitoxin system VapC family toxin [Chelatococcus sambhunathii]|uniref:Ribonuclease VapC n=1 Tax=Chelatococcus sambhunathii TaxID=363953 RepID=A0ABU1DFI1_9HYPH|nr:type II toxin-antitoxin system VapC family toxin [Chelatococcus sambhunathii]MDR4306857.1 type II toxin-antitoxin system VapC family toxin [Chelatococcus sambhunathii]